MNALFRLVTTNYQTQLQAYMYRKNNRHGKIKGFEKAIEYEAFLLAEKDSFRKTKEEYYFEAEKVLLCSPETTNSKQTELFRILNTIFFEQLDTNQSKEEIAKDYLFFINENEKITDIAINNYSNRLSNVALATSDSSLDFISKRTMLISDFPIVGYSNNDYKTYEIDQPYYDAYDDGHAICYESNCPDLNRLGSWLMDCKPLLREGILTYLPNFPFKKTKKA